MRDLQLRSGDAVLDLDALGGGLRALRVGEWEVLDGYAAGEPHSGRRGHVLAPWPNRLYQGRYSWLGTQQALPVTDVAHQSASHGLVDKVPWDVVGAAEDLAELSVRVPVTAGYPFEVVVGVRYDLTDDGLEVTLSARNEGADPAPFGAGMHPYFRCGADADETSVQVAATEELVLGDHRRPTGETRPFDGRLGVLGARVFDAALRCSDPGSAATLAGPAGTLRLGFGAAYRWMMLFTGDTLPEGERRRSVAVEPMTCPPGAFATGTDVISLPPGGTWSDSWSVRWEPA